MFLFLKSVQKYLELFLLEWGELVEGGPIEQVSLNVDSFAGIVFFVLVGHVSEHFKGDVRVLIVPFRF